MARNLSQRARFVVAGAGAATVGLLCLSQTAFASPGDGDSPLPTNTSGVIRGADAKGAIKDSYIVVYKHGQSSVSATTDRLAKKYRATVGHRYSDVLDGFSARMSATQAAKLASDPSVAYVEQDQTVSIATTQTPAPSWGLDRIDQTKLPLNNAYTYPRTGAGVRVYIVDTGIQTTTKDFGGRAIAGANFTTEAATDLNGHGTHVAGIAGGTTYGVAKGVQLVSVKVLNGQGSGTTSSVIQGVQWVATDHARTKLPAVANMSLGYAAGNTNKALDDAVSAAITTGVTFVVAAGNSSTSACSGSPSGVPAAVTVGATDKTDAKATYSNFGPCVDIFAPGSDITSDWKGSDIATNTISGTSMATPFVTGAAALILQATPTATPATVASKLTTAATPNVLTNLGAGSPSRLLRVA